MATETKLTRLASIQQAFRQII